VALALLGEAVHHRKAQARALAQGFVVKNGSNARAITSGGMPVPVSVMQIATY
jgi:hypothetical protein